MYIYIHVHINIHIQYTHTHRDKNVWQKIHLMKYKPYVKMCKSPLRTAEPPET